jgi:pSer/pThr/pTyr-binding forkhead associated (FHA) protein
MGSKHDEPVDPSQPALILMYGEAIRRRRPLGRDAVTLGRARGCDIWLDAPDVSSLHCLITRAEDGWHLRDCASRSGTRLNGDAIREPAVLHDGDVLQIGPFSFRVYLPVGRPADGLSKGQRLAQSRRKLALLALAQRRKLRQLRAEPWAAELGQRQADLDRHAAAFRDREREYDQRLALLEQAEREVSRDRDALNQETDAFETRMLEAEEALIRHPSSGECQENARRAIEAPTLELGEDERRLEIRRQELCAFARHLKRVRQHLEPQQEQVSRQLEQLNRGFQAMHCENQESTNAREEWAREQAEASARLAQQRSVIAQAEAALRDQRAGLTRMMADLKQMQEALRCQQNAELEALRVENSQLHQLLAERDRERVEATAAEAKSDTSPRGSDLHAEIDLLRQLLAEKDTLVEDLRRQPSQVEPAFKPVADIDTYEAELNAYRLQLEKDRKKLNDEIEQLRSRNAELDEATKEMELELSRERAELARERTRLERLREDARAELERVQREAGARERLAPVQKLRQELTGNASASADDNALNARPRGGRGQLSDASA